MFTPSLAVQRVAAQSERPATRPGPGTIRLASGDPDFETPEYIRRALIEAVEQGYTHYADGQGDPDLRAALAAQAARVSGHNIEPSNVLVTHGGSAALSAALLATVNPGDRILLPGANLLTLCRPDPDGWSGARLCPLHAGFPSRSRCDWRGGGRREDGHHLPPLQPDRCRLPAGGTR